MYTIILSDKTKLENLEFNGNNYVSPVLIEDSVFDNNLGTVTIINHDSETSEAYKDMVLIQNVSYDGISSYFILGEGSPASGDLEARVENIESTLDEIMETFSDIESYRAELAAR